MSKIKIITSEFNEQTGKSIVTIQTPLGLFTGESQLDEEDKAISSKYAGCQYAEMKAIMKYFKRKISNYKIEINALENFNKSMRNKKDYDNESAEMRSLRKEIYIKKKNIKDYEDRLNSLRNHLLKNIEQREKVVKRVIKQKEMKQLNDRSNS